MSDIETPPTTERRGATTRSSTSPIIDEDDEPVVESAYDRPGRWYIVHTFAGHEQKVIGALNNIIKSRELSELDLRDLPARRGRHRVQVRQEGHRLQAHVPELPADALRAGPRDLLRHRLDPGRDRLRRRREDQARPRSRAARSTTSSVPTSRASSSPSAKRRMPTHEFEVNDTVQIKTGPFATFSGHVAEINEDQLKVKVLVDIFGRETPVELDFTQVTKL